MPFTGIYADNDHVLGHELVHVFQYSVAEAGPGGLARLGALPLWLIEGMSEYLSLGRDDPLTAMWLRDAASATTSRRSSSSPPTRASSRIATGRRCGRTWADAGAIARSSTSTARRCAIGFEEGIRRVLGVSTDSLSKDWIAATRRAYLPVLEGRTRPNGAGDPVLQTGRKRAT